MAITDRPNKDILTQAIDIYRDCMRKFLVRHLKQVPRRTLKEAVEDALSDNQRSDLADHLKLGNALEGYIDVIHFGRLISVHWKSVFSNVWRGDRIIVSHCDQIRAARNQVAHPGTQDISDTQAITCLEMISQALDFINCPNQRDAVKGLQGRFMGPDLEELRIELGELGFQVDDMRAISERRDNDIDRAMGELHPKVREINDEQTELAKSNNHIQHQVEQLHGELAGVGGNIDSLKDEFERLREIVSELRSSNAQESLGASQAEIDSLVSDVENTRRIMVELRSENASLRDSVDTLTAQIAELDASSPVDVQQVASEIVDRFLAQLEKRAVTDTDDEEDWLEDGSEWDQIEEEADDQEDDEDEESEGAAPNRILELFRASSSVDRIRRSDQPFGIFPGARYYCAEEGCVFFDGSPRAWWHQWKAVNHMEITGHQIAEV